MKVKRTNYGLNRQLKSFGAHVLDLMSILHETLPTKPIMATNHFDIDKLEK